MEDSTDSADLKDTASGPYIDRLKRYQKKFRDYNARCDNIDKLYASLTQMADTRGERELKVFWANMEVLRPTIYSRPPRCVVDVRYSENSPVKRVAAEMLERFVEYDIEADGLHETLRLVRDDLAIAGRGVVWVLEDGEAIHVDREDFAHDPARKWAETGWVARAAYLDKDQFAERFPNVKMSKIKFSEKEMEDDEPEKAKVWEMWVRSEGRVVWFVEDYPDLLDEDEPLVSVKGFFPCPKPVYSTTERRTLLPVPDFVYYRDQVDEINELTARISALSESLRMKGFYGSGESEVGEAIETAMKSTDHGAILVPVSSAAAMGGSSLKDSIIWLPVAEIANVITSCIALRRQLMEDVYEITGLSDIMRGATQASETATAQNLKAQYGSVRVRERQGEMVRIARDVLELKAEIAAESVPAEEMALVAQMQVEPDVLYQVDMLLKDERLRPFALDVESDSTIAPDEEAEKASRIEFLTAVSSFMERAFPMVQAAPQMGPFAAEMLKFTANGFRAGREIAPAIEELAEMVAQAAQQPQQQQGPSLDDQVKMATAKADIAHTQAETQKTQAETQKTVIEMAGVNYGA